jgi:hypothetical protein
LPPDFQKSFQTEAKQSPASDRIFIGPRPWDGWGKVTIDPESSVPVKKSRPTEAGSSQRFPSATVPTHPESGAMMPHPSTDSGTPTLAKKPQFREVIIVGNETYKTSVLKKAAGVNPGDVADPLAAENGRRKIEKYCRDHGNNKVRVTILEGYKTDQRLIYMVNEGPYQRILWIDMIGNTFVSSARGL